MSTELPDVDDGAGLSPAQAAGNVAGARSLGSVSEAVERYDAWASDYDREVFETLGFTGSDRIADVFAEHVADRSAAVLDLGCGTGAVGVRLASHGFTNIDGFDISPAMLQVATAKRVYRELAVVDLTGSLPAARYDASVSAGTFTSGHVGPGALEEIVTLVAPGAIVAWVIALSVWDAFEPALAEAGLEIVSRQVEAIRRDGPPEAVMLVARLTTG